MADASALAVDSLARVSTSAGLTAAVIQLRQESRIDGGAAILKLWACVVSGGEKWWFMLLTGTYERTLDEKQRLALPKRFRDLLGSEGQSLFLTPGTDGSLALYAEPAFARMADKLAAQSPTAHDVRAFGRLLYAQSQSVELDAQGRFRLPPELAKLAELGREVMLIGVGDRIELWDKRRWEAYLDQQQPRYDDLAESALSGGGPAVAASPVARAQKEPIEQAASPPGQPR